MPRGTITVAAGQIEARLMNEAEATLASIETAIQSAARAGADLLVLPECAYPAYLLGSADSYRGGRHLSSGAFLAWLCRQAGHYGMHVVSGFVEDTGDHLYNAATLIDDRGREVGRSRKCFLWHVDQDWYQPGRDIRAFDTRLGRIGMAICAETRMPEILATLTADGAELIAVPTCWINGSREPGRFENPQVTFLIEARAREFDVPFVCADKSGVEMPGVGYVGMSRITAAGGELLAESPSTGESVVTAQLALRPCKSPRISDADRRRLLSPAPPNRPAAELPRKIILVAVPGKEFDRLWAREDGQQWLEGLKQRNVALIVTDSQDESLVRRTREHANSNGMLLMGLCKENVHQYSESANIGCLDGQSVRSFAPSRVLVLDGAELLVFIGVPDDSSMLRARAIENRVYVVGVNQHTAMIVCPKGEILATADQDGWAEVEFDLSAAGDKNVAPRTDIFNGRCVDAYHF